MADPRDVEIKTLRIEDILKGGRNEKLRFTPAAATSPAKGNA